jgi:nucleotide-binding universal stress UspA family protein
MGCGLRLLHVAPDLAAKRGDAYADVPVEIDVVQGQPAKAVVDASRTADLLVIIRRPLAFPFGSLGGTGRAILRESRCPVEVLPATARRRADGRNRGAEPAALGVMF